ncbi:hypothetical protein GT045_12580 [Streptomyces sp. SID486]|uniref:hypothetical protein n=1 Tax=unclassified Streptomyces TaxID=2593676 RepID=UPI00136CD6E9|nr:MULTISPECIES: hypothetical protein [unclassified Streptomyces]MYW19408.1 hypothetical protein [Streptomyces sp. SID2955]MYW44409.1 hypothetical protein [Streptomyces sp. SID161]MYX95625.1 hypothetical protein [Streptomyces sp. SID486]
MAAPAPVSIPAQYKPAPYKPVADTSAGTHEAPLCAFSAESACTQAPLTSEPPLPDAEPLTSEPPLAEAAPLTSESDPVPASFAPGL